MYINVNDENFLNWIESLSLEDKLKDLTLSDVLSILKNEHHEYIAQQKIKHSEMCERFTDKIIIQQTYDNTYKETSIYKIKNIEFLNTNTAFKDVYRIHCSYLSISKFGTNLNTNYTVQLTESHLDACKTISELEYERILNDILKINSIIKKLNNETFK